MRTWEGRLLEIRFNQSGRGGWIECPAGAIPSPGQYVFCWTPDDDAALLPVPVYSTGVVTPGFTAAATLPVTWEPGCRLLMRGPSGRGFKIPADCQRLALLALGESFDRLLAVIHEALNRDIAVAVRSHPALPALPAEIEIFPENLLGEVLSWADFLVFDIEIDQLNEFLDFPGRTMANVYRPEGQVLIHASMPCGGMADCGVCAVSTVRGARLVCKDGPVFDLNQFWFS